MGRNFVLKSEICKKEIPQYSEKTYFTPVLEYYKDINSQNFINSFFFKEKLKSKNEGQIIESIGNSKRSELLYNYEDFYGKKSSQKKIPNDIINEKKNNSLNFNKLNKMINFEEKKNLKSVQNKLFLIIFIVIVLLIKKVIKQMK